MKTTGAPPAGTWEPSGSETVTGAAWSPFPSPDPAGLPDDASLPELLELPELGGELDAGGTEPVDEPWLAPVGSGLTDEGDEAVVPPVEDPDAVDGWPELVAEPVSPVPPPGALDVPPRAAAVSGDGTDPPAVAPITGAAWACPLPV